jgi:RecB family exonuclease
MLLLTGPPSSGKTSYCLDRIREHLRAGDRNWRLLVPTATLAEHLRNQLAREGFVFSPIAISTLVKFVDNLAADLPQISEGGLEIITAEVLSRACPERYMPVRDFAGFRRALASAIDEFTSAGAGLTDLPSWASDFGAVLAPVLAGVRSRGLHLQASRVQHASQRLQEEDTHYYLAGFYSFNNPELDFIRRLASLSPSTVAITEWTGSTSAISVLRDFATQEQSFIATESGARRTLVAAPTLDSELTDIARRIRVEHENGRPWHEMVILVRSESPYVPAIRSALERFDIPGRFYFGSPLAQHPVVRFLTAVIDAFLAGWEHVLTLEALRLPGSPLEHDDCFDYAVRSRLPGSGLSELAEIAGDGCMKFFESLTALTSWTPEATAAIWADRFRALRGLCHLPEIQDRVPHEHALLLRSFAAALAAWDEAVSDAAAAFSASPVSCEQFREALRTVLASISLRPPDHRRDVVHVIDVYEARQWRVPVVFLCGLVEKQFPKYQSENPILGDDIRRHLQTRGFQLRTSIEMQSDEQFLFDCALGRATDAVFLSYPQLNAKADANLASFLLERARPFVTEAAIDARPAPIRPRAGNLHPSIFDEELRHLFALKHNSVAASAVETYLQCPYQFFARHSLNLAEAPLEPWDRLNPLVQGDIAHTVLERVFREKQSLDRAFADIFEATCDSKRVPNGYRTEAIRLDLLHNLQLLVYDGRIKPGTKTLYEQKFELPLGDGATVRGRIDRIEIDTEGRAVIFDYKYSSRNSVNLTETGHERKIRVQGGLYLLALAGLGSYKPAGMVYCGFKREVSFGGWIIRPYYAAIAKDCAEDRLHEVMRLAREAALETTQKIRAGDIKPAPADESRCEFCACAKMCRVETLPAAAAAGGGSPL